MSNVDRMLDLKGLSCPMPLLKAKKALKSMKSGEVLKVYATDPGSVRDFASFARISGHTLMATQEEEGTFIHTVKHK